MLVKCYIFLMIGHITVCYSIIGNCIRCVISSLEEFKFFILSDDQRLGATDAIKRAKKKAQKSARRNRGAVELTTSMIKSHFSTGFNSAQSKQQLPPLS